MRQLLQNETEQPLKFINVLHMYQVLQSELEVYYKVRQVL